MSAKDLFIFQKAYDFFVWQKDVINHLAKVHKYSLGIKIENETLDLVRKISRANIERENKKEKIKDCLEQIDVLFFLLRVGNDMSKNGGISEKNYIQASERLLEIEKMLYGWMKC